MAGVSGDGSTPDRAGSACLAGHLGHRRREGAARGLEHGRSFLAGKAPEAARRAAQATGCQLLLLETQPSIGWPLPELPELRELVIAFGDSRYVTLYRHEVADDAVCVLAFRHQKEAGY